MSRSYVMYHSVQGNTEYVAGIIARVVQGDLVKINKEQKVIRNPFATGACVMRQYLRRKQFVDRLDMVSIASYDTVFICTPCWFYDVTPPIQEAMKRLDFQNTCVYFVITHGGDIGISEAAFKAYLRGGRYMGMIEFCNAKQLPESEIEKKLMNKLVHRLKSAT